MKTIIGNRDAIEKRLKAINAIYEEIVEKGNKETNIYKLVKGLGVGTLTTFLTVARQREKLYDNLCSGPIPHYVWKGDMPSLSLVERIMEAEMAYGREAAEKAMTKRKKAEKQRKATKRYEKLNDNDREILFRMTLENASNEKISNILHITPMDSRLRLD